MIYLLRHGDAEPDLGEGDAARRLTAKGEKQSRIAGLAIARLGYEVGTCLASPRVRALDTARIACLALGIEPEVSLPIGDGSYEADDLAIGRGNVLLVGHEPVLSMEVARLTGASVKMKKGGLAVLEPGTLRVLLRPAELAAIATSPAQ